MTKTELAAKHNINVRFIYNLLAKDKRKRKYTENPGLALDLSALTGKTPIDFFNPNRKELRAMALAARPELAKKQGR